MILFIGNHKHMTMGSKGGFASLRAPVAGVNRLRKYQCKIESPLDC